MNNFFSVLIPSYNRPEYIEKTINSVLNNNYNNYEILVSDDNSPRQDEIKKINEKYDKKIVKFFYQKKNLGEANNRQFLIDKSLAHYVIFLSDDDLLSQNCLKCLNTYINNNKKTKLFLFGFIQIDEKQNIKKNRRSLLKINLNSYKIKERVLQFSDFPYYYFSPVTFCIEKQVCSQIKTSDEVGIADDLAFISECLLQNINSIIIPEKLMFYRKFSSEFVYEQKNASESKLKQKESLYLLYKFLVQKYSDSKLGKYLDSDKYVYNFLLKNKAIKFLLESNIVSKNDKILFKQIYKKHGLFDIIFLNKLKNIVSYIKINIKNI